MNWIFNLGNAKVDSPNGRKRVLKAPIVYVYGSINFEVERRSCQETSIPFRQVGKKKKKALCCRSPDLFGFEFEVR
jgi:hypothetical protein